MSRKKKGPTRQFVVSLSEKKNEPGWMTDMRLKALDQFYLLPMPAWGPDLSALDTQDIQYYVQSPAKQVNSWQDIPSSIQETLSYLGLPQAERDFLAGLGVQYESEQLYKNLREEWAACGVVFVDTDTGLKEHSDLFRRYFGSVVSGHDNKFAALNTALWSGGSFVYVPRGIALDKPLQAYFRIETERVGQFERTLIIVEDDSSLHYVEGCSAPIYRTQSLHCGVVELCAHKNSRVRYTTIQNWSTNVYNLVTKRAVAHENAVVEWIDGNIGSAVTMKYPSVILKERGARANLLSLSFATAGQVQDTGGAMIHCAPDTHSLILSKAISKKNGVSNFRSKIFVQPGATGVTARSQCDALLLSKEARAAAYPDVQVSNASSFVGHEGSVTAFDNEQLFYLMSRGLSMQQAYSMLINGFAHACISQIPAEYAIELQALLEREMEGE